tara:strand:- start:510 stop:653 length:144 start_codon:yes stop_codon:yes gene_type:complete
MTLLGYVLLGSTTLSTLIVLGIVFFGKSKRTPLLDKHKAVSTYEDTL